MTPSLSRRILLNFLPVLAFCMGTSSAIASQEKPRPSAPINLDRALQEPLPQDRAQSYYHFSLAKWHEEQGDLEKALSNMQTALRYDSGSTSLRIELAGLLLRTGDLQGAISSAQEAAHLEPKDPEPYWFLANAYLESDGRSRRISEETLRKSAKELEAMKEVAPNDERAYYRLGDLYFRLNQPEKAIEAYEKFQALVPDLDAGYMAIANYYERVGNDQKKIEYLQKAIERRPDSAQALVGLAGAYAVQNNDREAIPLYRKALELSAGNPLIKKQLAVSLVNVGEFAEARELLEELERVDPRDDSVKILLGRVHLGEVRYREAIDTFKTLLANDPGNLEAEYYLGTSHELSGDMSEAAGIFEGLTRKAKNGSEEQKANLPVFQQHLASAYQQMGDNAKAIAVYEDMLKGQADPDPRVMFFYVNALRVDRQLEKALELGKRQLAKNPGDTASVIVYARTLADTGKIKEAAELLRPLLSSEPANTDIPVNLSQIYLQGQKYAEAEEVLNKAVVADADRQRLQIQLAAVYDKMKAYDKAEAVLAQILKKDPKEALALNFLGYMLADRGVRLEEAVRYIQDALAREPHNGAYLDSLGWAYFKMNELDKAEDNLLKAIERIKNDPVIYDHLGDLYQKKGDLLKAQDFWQKSLRYGIEEEEIKKVRDKLKKLPRR